MNRGRRLAIGVAGVALMFLVAGLGLRLAGDGGGDVDLRVPPGTVEVLTGDAVDPGYGILPGDPPVPLDTSLPPVAEPPPVPDDPAATLPAPGVVTIPLPDFGTAGPTGPAGPVGPGAAPTNAGPAFGDTGVWVVKADGSSPFLVARGATAGVAVGGAWVAFMEGGTVKAVRRSDLRAKRDLATGVSGTAAQGLAISGGRGGVAFVRDGRVLLVDPEAPAQPKVAYDAPGADAVAAEEDGEGRLVWADDAGLHVGVPEPAVPAAVQAGMLVLGHGVLASLQDGRVRVEGGPSLDWGAVDRLQTGSGGLVAGSNGRVRLHTGTGEDRTLLDRAATPVVTGSRIFYVASGRSLALASLSGSGPTVVASAAPGRTITNLDLLDDATLVVTVA